MTIGAWTYNDKYYLTVIGAGLVIVSVVLQWIWLFYVSLIIVIIGIVIAYREKNEKGKYTKK